MQPLLCQSVPAEDGVGLATDVFLPDGPGPFPTIVFRTPYHRVGQAGGAMDFVERGYAFVAQDCRGKYDSDGVFEPLVDEARDGQTTLDWVANQKWCNGRIGLWGRSYPGIVQVPAASGGHEALQCIVPAVAPTSFFHDWIRHDGCFAFANAVRWSLTHAVCRNQPPQAHFDWRELHRLETPAAIAERVGFQSSALRAWVEHDCYDEYWRAVDQDGMHEKIRVPGFYVGGWFDHLTRGTVSVYRNVRREGATELARNGQRLFIGPWGHRTVGAMAPEHHRYGDWDFGAEADLSVMAHELQCLDHYLRDADNGYDAQPAVKVFLMGENRWISLSDWPPPEAKPRYWHLTSNGGANGRIGDGRLTEETPDSSNADRYQYDPHDPTPTRGGPLYWGLDHLGPVDQRPLLDRADLLFYRGERLLQPLAVVGEINAELHISSDAEDTDFVVKLCVEEVSGAVICLTHGSLRCRFRESWSDPQPLQPGEATAIHLQMGHLAYVFPAGSRVCLTVTSSDFPRLLPHPNSMAPLFSAARPVVALNSVHHGPGALSRLELPVLEAY